MIAQAIESRSHQRSKRVFWCYHLILEIIRWLDVNKVSTDQNISDHLTNALRMFEKHEKTIAMGYQFGFALVQVRDC